MKFDIDRYDVDVILPTFRVPQNKQKKPMVDYYNPYKISFTRQTNYCWSYFSAIEICFHFLPNFFNVKLSNFFINKNVK